MIGHLIRVATWLYVGVLICLTLGPASVRPDIRMPHCLEHLAAFGLSGLFFSIGYRFRSTLLGLWGGAFTAFLEILQMWVPDRHARFTDFAMDTLGFWIGIVAGLAVRRNSGVGAGAMKTPDRLDRQKPNANDTRRCY